MVIRISAAFRFRGFISIYDARAFGPIDFS